MYGWTMGLENLNPSILIYFDGPIFNTQLMLRSELLAYKWNQLVNKLIMYECRDINNISIQTQDFNARWIGEH